MSRGRYISGADELLPDEPLELPEQLPPHPVEGREWTAHAERVWRALRESPARAAWIESDLGAVESLLLAEDEVAQGGLTAAMSGELRRLRDTLGLTPLSRVRLGLSPEQPDTATPLNHELDDEYRKLIAEVKGGGS